MVPTQCFGGVWDAGKIVLAGYEQVEDFARANHLFRSLGSRTMEEFVTSATQ